MTPLYAVVSLLSEPYYQKVEALWTELETHCGIHGIYATPFPHFSYHVARSYDLPRLESLLRRFARSHKPFQVRTTGVGVFCGQTPVVYIPVVRSPELSEFHRKLWPQIGKAAEGTLGYYQPDEWVPHITLGHGDINQTNLPAVIGQLAPHDLTWAVTIDNLAVISSSGADQGLHLRVPLGE